jgi:hypothetical protein
MAAYNVFINELESDVGEFEQLSIEEKETLHDELLALQGEAHNALQAQTEWADHIDSHKQWYEWKAEDAAVSARIQVLDDVVSRLQDAMED